MYKSEDYVDDDREIQCCGTSLRNIIAFFLLGLMNNFAYVVFLSAALDLVEGSKLPPAVILISDIAPSLVVQGLAPFFMEKIPFWIRVLFITITAFGSFLIVTFFNSIGIALLGIIVASVSSGFGEITFMSLSSFYHKNTVSAYSSGTGAAGIAGSFIYLALTSWANLGDRVTLFICSPLPLLIAVSYFVIMGEYENVSTKPVLADSLPINVQEYPTEEFSIPFKKRIQLQWRLFRYSGPLALVYFAEYLINQSIVPTIAFPKSKTIGWPPASVYRYYQFIYQVGVFISRSSVNLIQIRKIWALGLWQTVNMVLLWSMSYFDYVPSVWIVFAIILYEGLVGGAVFVNAFYLVSTDIEAKYREFCLGSLSFWYAAGILLSAITGSFVQPWLLDHACNHYWPTVQPGAPTPLQYPCPTHPPVTPHSVFFPRVL